MSTVKISQLPNLTHLDSNTSNTILVGIDNSTSVTSQFTARTLAESLYSNTALNVGNNAIILPNVIAQFVGNSSAYLQTNLQNRTPSGSADHVITADVGTDEKDYIDLGIHGSTSSDAIFTSILPLDGYLFVQGNTATSTGGNLIIGTTTAGRTVNIIAGGPSSDKLQVKISTDGVNLVAKPLKFADGSSQNTSMDSAGTFANGAFVKANSGFTLANSASLYANGAFDTANSASVFANGAFGASNSASSYANSAFIRANAVFSQSNNQVWPQANAAFEAANSAALYANGAFIQANAVFSQSNNQVWPQANAAFGAANSVSSYANAAFIQANAVFTQSNNQVWPQANAAFNSSNTVGVYANAAFGVANSAALYANGAFIAANTATSASLYANGAFAASNSASAFANGAFINSNNAYTAANSGSLFANGAFGAANSAGQYANAAFSKANSAQTLAATQAGRLDVIEPIAQAAFTNAASALQNTSGTFAGSLTITGSTFAQAMNTTNLQVVGTANVSGTLNVLGDVTMNARVFISNAISTSTQAAVTISATSNTSLPSNDGYMLHISGKPNVPTRIVTDAYGTGAYTLLAGRSARGNVDYPSAIQTGDIINRWSGNGYGTTKFQTLGVGRIDFVAVENFTDASTGTQIQFWNCPVGSNTLVNILTLNGDSAEFTGVVKPDKGFIYTPRIPAGNQTAIAIDYASDSMIKANLVADLTVSHSNFVTGKVVEVWLVNTGGSGRSVTHGLTALNSTTNSTTFTIPATSSAYLKFFSIDGDLANTFVSVVYS
jgi:hypothetical protein